MISRRFPHVRVQNSSLDASIISRWYDKLGSPDLDPEP